MCLLLFLLPVSLSYTVSYGMHRLTSASIMSMPRITGRLPQSRIVKLPQQARQPVRAYSGRLEKTAGMALDAGMGAVTGTCGTFAGGMCGLAAGFVLCAPVDLIGSVIAPDVDQGPLQGVLMGGGGLLGGIGGAFMGAASAGPAGVAGFGGFLLATTSGLIYLQAKKEWQESVEETVESMD